MTLPLHDIPTPCYVVDTDRLAENLAVFDRLQRETGCRVLLALKGFALFSVFPQLRETLSGVAASSLNEARLGREEFDREVHVYAPAYRDEDFVRLLEWCDHLVFNSFRQWEHFQPAIQAFSHGGGEAPLFGLRINPEYSEVPIALYNPCRSGSRLGVTRDELAGRNLDGFSGVHFHCLCEQGADVLERTLAVVMRNFDPLLTKMEWINLGGGHLITRKDYALEQLGRCIASLRERYGLRVYLEPGEAVVRSAGFLVARVLDVLDRAPPIAVLDTSATAHMPDVLEMPYRPDVLGAGRPGEKPYTYRLGGLTCLAGDVIGAYAFDAPLQPGDKLVFQDMAHYTMVKNTTFNGVPLPSIGLYSKEGGFTLLRRFGYEAYRNRLA